MNVFYLLNFATLSKPFRGHWEPNRVLLLLSTLGGWVNIHRYKQVLRYTQLKLSLDYEGALDGLSTFE